MVGFIKGVIGMGSGRGGTEIRTHASPSEFLQKIKIEERNKIYQILIPKVTIIFKCGTV
jgi:hypothetical protein